MESKSILAKTAGEKHENVKTLLDHTLDIMETFQILFGTPKTPTQLAKKWLSFFNISQEDFPVFHDNGLAACCFHDIGKANSGFQRAIRNQGDQLIRHEHLSGLIFFLPNVKNWIDSYTGFDSYIIISSVISHHLKVNSEKFCEHLNPNIEQFRIYPSSIIEIINNLCNKIAINPLSDLGCPELWSFYDDEIKASFSIEQNKRKLERYLRDNERAIKDDRKRKSLLIAVRAAVIAADSAGSGITREKHTITEWLSIAFNENELLDGNKIEDKVIKPRIEDIIRRNEFHWHSFQIAAESLPARALLLAPCGSGKTLAAWRWIKGQLYRKSAARVIFLYPTRGTATEGFKDYVSWAPEADAALIHGTSVYELEGMFENPGDIKSGKDYSTDDRLFAIGFWQKKIFSATVDQFLGFMQHYYRSVCLIPLLVDSVIVIDEVHSFDEYLFAALRKFLQSFDVPVLCMTASLTSSRRNILESLGLRSFPAENERTKFDDLEKNAEMKRYRINCLISGDSIDQILEQNRSGKKILWVVNTVDRCQKLAMKYRAPCYHSRFKLEDRKKIHNSVVDIFKSTTEKTALVITTQVCEMSLDLDADILITEAAPITSLIQRMGRCNRHSKPEDKKIGNVYIYEPENILPYEKEELSGKKEFLNEINGKEISQRDLENLLERFGPKLTDPERYTAFTDSAHWAMSHEAQLRDASEYTIDSLLDCDVSHYLSLKKQKKPTDGLFVPVPRKIPKFNDEIKKYVANKLNYSDKYGFLKEV